MKYDVIVIGGGQSGLAVGYYLRRSGLSFTIFDKEAEGGGSWQHYWKSLRLFSPAQWSSLPGVMMPGGGHYYPTRDETIAYLRDYERKYELPLQRGVTVSSVAKNEDGFVVTTSAGVFYSRALISATGSFANAYIPAFNGMEGFAGRILHSADYRAPENFKGQRVAIVGEGNSGAQILAEVSNVADTLWITQKEPRFLGDHIDGRYLFDAATQMYEAKLQGKSYQPPSLGDVVMVPSVKAARDRNKLGSVRPFQKFTPDGLQWADGHEEKVDAVIFCTGFRPSLGHLQGLGVINGDGRATTEETKSTAMEGLWLVGYGNWTGFASATLIGVGRSAKRTVEEVKNWLQHPEQVLSKLYHR